jgi:benzoate/toluate 1,2-dioxygenase reductase component
VSHKIALNFEDGVTRFVTASSEEVIADAAYRYGVNIPIDCREGACGTCKSFCESGTYEISDYIEDALSKQELAAGYVLTCKTRALSDCVIRIPADSLACHAMDKTIRKARISGLELRSMSTIWLELEGPEIEKLQFLPGQYANLLIPGAQQSRAYSFSSLVKDGRVSFLIRNIPNGLMSSHLTLTAKAGDELHYQAPFGGFYLRKVERPVLMIAGGTGLAPFLAMLQQIEQAGIGHPVHLMYGVTRDEDLVELDQLDRFKTSMAGFDYTVCVVESGVSGRKTGVVTEHLLPEYFHAGQADVYLCGPPPMVSAVERFIAQQGLQPASMHFEKFLPSR